MKQKITSNDKLAKKCWEPINKGIEIINRQLDIVLNNQSQLETLIKIVGETDDSEINTKQKVQILKDLEHLSYPEIKEIATVLAQLHDRQQLCMESSGSSQGVSISLPEELNTYAE